MLKITVEESPQSTTLKLEGKLSGAWVDELDRTWQELTSHIQGKSITVDLAGVNFVDPEGKKLLSRMVGQGAELRAARLMTQYIIEELLRRMNGHKRNGG